MNSKKIIMTGGGTAGHVTPNIALIPKLIEEGYEIHYIGTSKGIEKRLIEEICTKDIKITYHTISSGKLRRYFDAKNLTDPFKVVKGMVQCFFIIKKEKPSIVFSKGGFVSVPVVIAAYLNKVPVIAHESDITPGLANRICMPYCNKICVTFPESLAHMKGNKAVLTGSPIRKELFEGDRARGLSICKFKSTKPILLIIGGSLGSKVINDTIREKLQTILKSYNVIHLCGQGNVDEKFRNIEGYFQLEYAKKELTDLYAASDMVISRAGANVIFELLALKKPNILIPLSAAASRGDQLLNASSFKNSGYSIVVLEEEIKANLIESIGKLYQNRSKYINKMKASLMQNSVELILKLIKETI